MESRVEIPVDCDSWQLANAIQLAVFRLLDSRDPATAHTVVFAPAEPGVDPYEIEVEDPYVFDLPTFEMRLWASETVLTIVADCELK